MRNGKAVYAAVLVLLAINISYVLVLVVRIPITIPRLLLAIGGLAIFVVTLLLYKSKRYKLLWLGALLFYGSVGFLGYDVVFDGDMGLLVSGTVALLLGVLGGGLALIREKPLAQKG